MQEAAHKAHSSAWNWLTPSAKLCTQQEQILEQQVMVQTVSSLKKGTTDHQPSHLSRKEQLITNHLISQERNN
jgi:hypothetical protein